MAGLCKEYEIRVITSDTDYGMQEPYSGIEKDRWTTTSHGMMVYYNSRNNLNAKHIKQLIKEYSPDHIYLNGMFSVYFTLIPLMINYLSQLGSTITIAPRGMLFSSALAKKSIKKKLFLNGAAFLFRKANIQFHATNKQEYQTVRHRFPNRPIYIANNLPAQIQAPVKMINKNQGSLNLVFVARIDRIKNLEEVLTILSSIKNQVRFTIVGPVDDFEHWAKCRNTMRNMPSNIIVDYRGAMNEQEIAKVLAENHLFVLLSQGENFGHAIFESLLAGRPVLISDRTPWRGLQSSGVGFDVDLRNETEIVACLESAISWNQQQFEVYAQNAWNFAHEYLNSDRSKEAYQQIFF